MDDIIEDTEAMRIILAGFAMTGVLSAYANAAELPAPEFVTKTSIAYANHMIGALKSKKQKPDQKNAP